MPIYEYRCMACGHQQEHLVKMNETPQVCPACGSDQYRKLLSAAAGFALKGSGWYATDYRPKPESRCGEGACSACQLAETE